MEWKNKLKELEKQNLSIRVEKENKVIYESSEARLKPLFTCFKKFPHHMHGSTVIDKVIGKAAAFICIMAKVERVFTPLASQSAVKVLKEQGIIIKAEHVIPQIMNKDKTDQCPMEKMADAAGSPELFIDELEKRIIIE